MKGVTIFWADIWGDNSENFASVMDAKTWAQANLNIPFGEWVQNEAIPTDWEWLDENENLVFIECGPNGIPEKTMADLPNLENCECEGGPNIGEEDFACQNCGCPA